MNIIKQMYAFCCCVVVAMNFFLVLMAYLYSDFFVLRVDTY